MISLKLTFLLFISSTKYNRPLGNRHLQGPQFQKRSLDFCAHRQKSAEVAKTASGGASAWLCTLSQNGYGILSTRELTFSAFIRGVHKRKKAGILTKSESRLQKGKKPEFSIKRTPAYY